MVLIRVTLNNAWYTLGRGYRVIDKLLSCGECGHPPLLNDISFWKIEIYYMYKVAKHIEDISTVTT